MTGTRASATAAALAERAARERDGLVAAGRWSPERDAALERSFEAAARAALAVRAPAERSVLLRRAARLVPARLRPPLRRALRALDVRLRGRAA